METEKRSHQRKNLAYEQIPGNFLIEVGETKHVFTQVNDVSVSGMGMLLDREIAPDTEVRISYHSPEFSVGIGATVIWSEKLGEDVYRLGVKFAIDKMDDNVMLFMTLREYIDDFGEAF